MPLDPPAPARATGPAIVGRPRGRHRSRSPRRHRGRGRSGARRLLPVLVTGAVAVAVAVPVLAQVARPGPGGGASALPPWRSGQEVGLGAAVPDPPGTSPLLPRPDLTVLYAALGAPVAAAELDRRAGGATLVLTLEPYDVAGGGGDAGTTTSTEQPAHRLARIVDGGWDEQLGRWAAAVAGARSPVMVRFAHEMNGTWYPWSEQVNGNRPGEYVAAWRHVVDLFRREGAADALWVWSPNVVEPGTAPLEGLWPGRGYVDVVGLDGYNWGGARPDTSWRSPARLFDATLAQVRALAPGVPVVITETACAEQGGDKAAWVRDLFAWVRAHDVAAVVWFAYDKEADWRPDSSPRSAQAFREGAATLS